MELDDKLVSAVVKHAKTILQAMWEASEVTEVEGQEVRTYEGALVRLVVNELGIGTPRYSQCLTMLKKMGAITQLRRGAGGQVSLWRLHRFPTDEEFADTAPPPLSKQAVSEQMIAVRQALRDLEGRMSRLERALVTPVQGDDNE
jgi:hypothetical protein